MDIILPPSSIKVFTSAIVCFSRIAGSSNSTVGSSGGGGGGGGTSSLQHQDIYWEFDPITGLDIRTMNDAKTAYANISYQPSFFTYCSTPALSSSSSSTSTTSCSSDNNNDIMTSQQSQPQSSQTSTSSTDENNNKNNQSANRRGTKHHQRRTLTCRITIKALIPIVRHRSNHNKSIESLQIRTYYTPTTTATTNGTNHRKAQQQQQQVHTTVQQPLGLEFIFTLRNNNTHNHNNNNGHHHHGNHNHTKNGGNNHQRLVIHRIPIVDTTNNANRSMGSVINPMNQGTNRTATGVAIEEPPSELIVSPTVLLRLFEPLQHTVEVALIVRSCCTDSNFDNNNNNNNNSNNFGDEVTTIGGGNTTTTALGSVSVSSFHHSDTYYHDEDDNTHDNSSRKRSTTVTGINNNAILQATTASLLKTETACTDQEFIEFDFITTRNSSNAVVGNSINIPDNVNDEVILVFPIKEAKAMLHFCSSCCSTTSVSHHHQQQQQFHPPKIENNVVHVSFHWGGKPLMIQTYNHNTTDTTIAATVPSYTMQLVLATMDYHLLTSMRTIAAGQ